MPYLGSSPGDAFTEGVDHLVNPGRGNDASRTLGGSLQAVSDKWDAESAILATSPHSVLAPYVFSRNASANGSDGQGYLPTGAYLGSSNGQSSENFEQNLSLRMAGGNAGVG